MNTATLWSNRLAGLFIDRKAFIILIELNPIIDVKILNSEIRENMIALSRIADGKKTQVLLRIMTNPDALNQGMRYGQEGNLVKDMPPALIILIEWTMIFVGTNFAISPDNNVEFLGNAKKRGNFKISGGKTQKNGGI